MIVKKRKGISTFIATLLLMVLAVAAGVVIYAYVMGYLGGFTTPQTMGALSLDNAALNTAAVAPTPALTAYLRNIGHTTFTLNTVYITYGTTTVKCLAPVLTPQTGDAANTIGENHVGTLTLPISEFPSDFGTAGRTYSIKVIGADNTQITFNVK
jgi:Kef-type K+ transport system membrane component KefB